MENSDRFLEKCQQVLGYEFKNVELLGQALTHASLVGNRLDSNERLEFLGDAILGMVVCWELFKRFPHYLEGELTKVKSMVVSRRVCAKIADKMGLDQFLNVGKGMASQRKIPMSCRAAALESIIGAVYLDGGEEAASQFILRVVGPILSEADASQHHDNFKSMLQQYSQRMMDATPVYQVMDEKGPDHSKCFEVSVLVGKQRFAGAWGPSKKEAEQLAAHVALQELGVISPPNI